MVRGHTGTTTTVRTGTGRFRSGRTTQPTRTTTTTTPGTGTGTGTRSPTRAGTGTRTAGSITRSSGHTRACAVSISLGVLGATAALQAVVFAMSGSVALLADLIHNGGDALTAIPLAIAFLLRSERGERWGGYAVVLAIFVSASVAGFEAVERLLHPQHLHYLLPLASPA